MDANSRTALKASLLLHENLRLKPYLDSKGKLTIGIGRNLDDRGITHAEAMYLCDNDIDVVIGELDAGLPWWKSMPEVQQQVLTEMAFNLGVPRLRGFVNMLAAAKAGNYKLAAAEMRDSKWAKEDVPARAEALAKLMES